MADAAEAQAQTQAQLVYADLRERIVKMELPPGAALSEARLARLLSSGPGPVRYAVQRLAAERLLIVSPRGGTVVPAMIIADVAQNYGVRTSLEFFGARRATAYGFIGLADRLEGFIGLIETATADRAFETVVDSSRLYWDHLMRGAQSEVLISTLAPVAAATDRFEYFLARQYERVIFDVAAAREMLDALRQRNADLAQEIILERVGRSRYAICAEFMNITLGA